ncbi:hypothetical protein Tco_1021250 [Tanacetum coccineum]
MSLRRQGVKTEILRILAGQVTTLAAMANQESERVTGSDPGDLSAFVVSESVVCRNSHLGGATMWLQPWRVFVNASRIASLSLLIKGYEQTYRVPSNSIKTLAVSCAAYLEGDDDVLLLLSFFQPSGSEPKKYDYISSILREYQELSFNSCTYLSFTNYELCHVYDASDEQTRGNDERKSAIAWLCYLCRAEGLPKYVSSGEGVEVCNFDNRGVERSYVPTKRSEYMDEEKFLQKSIKLLRYSARLRATLGYC